MIVTNGFTPVLPWIASRRTCRRNARKKRKGELDLYATLRGPLSPEGGTIGDIAPPMHSVVQQVGENELISANPLTVKFSVIDEQLALPAVAGCAPLNRQVNHRLGLPSPSGQDVFQQTSYVRFKPYA
jgi:hypothetical protein